MMTVFITACPMPEPEPMSEPVPMDMDTSPLIGVWTADNEFHTIEFTATTYIKVDSLDVFSDLTCDYTDNGNSITLSNCIGKEAENRNGLTLKYTIDGDTLTLNGTVYTRQNSDVPEPTVPGTMAAPTLKVGNKQLTVNWTPPKNNGGSRITAYELRHSDDGGSSWSEDITTADAPATETIITGLTNGTTYVVQARARNSAGAGEWSGSSEGATPISTVPTEPNGFVLSVDMQTITATWTAPTDTGDSVITHYELQHREVGTSAWEPVIATADADTLTLLIPNLTKGAEYEVQVYAVNTDGNGNPTEIKKITIPATVPSAPNAPTLTGGNTELVVAWTVPNNGGSPITSYKVQYSSDGGTNWTPAPGNPISATSYTIPSLMNGTTYDVQVRAVNTVGDGGWSVSATLTLPTKPAALTAPTLAGGNARLVVEWTAPDDGGSAITEYKVQYSSDGESTWTAVTDTIHGTTTSSTITGLTNGTSYVVQVRAANMQGDGDWSASATAMLPVPVFATQVPSGTAASVVLSTAIDTQIVTENLTVSLAPVTSAASTVTLPTVTASTGLITVTATTTAGTYVVSGADGGGIERFSEHFHVTVSPADNAALDTQVTAGITAWGNTADLNYIVTAAVTNMSEVFKDASTFNGDISDWDVSKVTDMSDMFRGANVFNQNISGWTVSSVTDMSGMFRDAHAFNQDLTNWTVSSVTNMNNMFIYARTFNGDISNWDTGAVTTMAQMFNGASVFNNDISGWNVSKVENMYWMFYQASGFSQNLNDWAWNNSVSPAVPWKTSDGGKWNNGTYIGVKGAMFTGSGVTGDLIPSWY